jgi:hypothetical protein
VILGKNFAQMHLNIYYNSCMRNTEWTVLVPGASAAGCMVERTPHLYPANDVASKTGVLQGLFVGHGTGHGTADITMADGEILRGEYTIVADGAVSFGSVFSTVYGSGSSSSIAMAGKGTGEAALAGDRGTSAQCEFLNNNLTGHGNGACRSSTGGIYKLIC